MRSRSIHGEAIQSAKLTESDVRMMRQIYREGREQIARILLTCSQKALAEKFGVDRITVQRALNYTTWKHVHG